MHATIYKLVLFTKNYSFCERKRNHSQIRLRGEFSPNLDGIAIDQSVIDRLQLGAFVICHFKNNALETD